jgi:hypothetical protein
MGHEVDPPEGMAEKVGVLSSFIIRRRSLKCLARPPVGGLLGSWYFWFVCNARAL